MFQVVVVIVVVVVVAVAAVAAAAAVVVVQNCVCLSVCQECVDAHGYMLLSVPACS